jgi:hypothetical protein
MHILTHLGFVGVYPIYWSKEINDAIIYRYSKYACIRLSRTKMRYNLDKILSKPRRHIKL